MFQGRGNWDNCKAHFRCLRSFTVHGLQWDEKKRYYWAFENFASIFQDLSLAVWIAFTGYGTAFIEIGALYMNLNRWLFSTLFYQKKNAGLKMFLKDLSVGLQSFLFVETFFPRIDESVSKMQACACLICMSLLQLKSRDVSLSTPTSCVNGNNASKLNSPLDKKKVAMVIRHAFHKRN